MKNSWLLSLSLALCFGCTPPSDNGSGGSGGGATGGSGGSTGGRGGSGGSTGGSTGGTSGTGGTTGGTGDSTGGTGGTGGSTGGTGGSTGGTGGSTGGTGGSTGGTGGSTGGTGGSSTDGGGQTETPSGGGGGGMWGELDGAFMDVKCATGRSGGFCRPEMMGMKTVMFKFGGDAGKMYDVKLRVWMIAEGIAYSGGMPVDDHFYIGGMGTTANYGPCGLEIGTQRWFLNRHAMPGRDTTRKFEYVTPAIKIPGQASVSVFCRDTNNHLTMNSERGRHVIMNPPPELAAKLGMQPVEGHFIYLKVESATAAP